VDHPDLKAKIIEWLKLKNEADGLEKSIKGVHEQHDTAKEGVSIAGKDIRSGIRMSHDKVKDIFGYLKSGKAAHKNKLNELKEMPKPNLPKTEVIPNQVSDPKIINRVDTSAPRVIDSPNTMNPKTTKSEGTRSSGEYMRVAEMFSHLKNKKKE
jgi:hypothetical protein